MAASDNRITGHMCRTASRTASMAVAKQSLGDDAASTITGASPLSCVKLFTRGKQLRKMAWMQLVHSCTDGHVTYQLQQVHSVRLLLALFPSCL